MRVCAAARPSWVVDTTFDLFCDLATDDDQIDFETVYASGIAGKAGMTTELSENLEPLFEAIINYVSPLTSPCRTLFCLYSSRWFLRGTGATAAQTLKMLNLRKVRNCFVCKWQMFDDVGGNARRCRHQVSTQTRRCSCW